MTLALLCHHISELCTRGIGLMMVKFSCLMVFMHTKQYLADPMPKHLCSKLHLIIVNMSVHKLVYRPPLEELELVCAENIINN